MREDEEVWKNIYTENFKHNFPRERRWWQHNRFWHLKAEIRKCGIGEWKKDREIVRFMDMSRQWLKDFSLHWS